MYFVNFLLIKPIMCSKNANIFAFSYPGNFIVAGFEQYESYARTSQFFVPMPFLENFYKWGTKLLVPVRWPRSFATFLYKMIWFFQKSIFYSAFMIRNREKFCKIDNLDWLFCRVQSSYNEAIIFYKSHFWKPTSKFHFFF